MVVGENDEMSNKRDFDRLPKKKKYTFILFSVDLTFRTLPRCKVSLISIRECY